MSHTCSAALVRCMDFRLEGAIEEYLNKQKLVGDIDIISYAGAAKDINLEESNAVEGQIDLSKRLHNIGTVILMNHTDCGGYGGSEAFENLDAERKHHISELEKAEKQLASTYKDLIIKKVLATIKEDGSIDIEDIHKE